jgi:hypothetical protein
MLAVSKWAHYTRESNYIIPKNKRKMKLGRERGGPSDDGLLRILRSNEQLTKILRIFSK